MKSRTVKIVDVFMVEKKDPSASHFGFDLSFYGKTPGGKDLTVKISLPAWGIDEIGQRLHEVLKRQEQLVAASRQILEGKL